MYVYMYAKIYICLRKSEYHNRFSSLPYVYNYFSFFSYLLESMKFDLGTIVFNPSLAYCLLILLLQYKYFYRKCLYDCQCKKN